MCRLPGASRSVTLTRLESTTPNLLNPASLMPITGQRARQTACNQTPQNHWTRCRCPRCPWCQHPQAPNLLQEVIGVTRWSLCTVPGQDLLIIDLDWVMISLLEVCFCNLRCINNLMNCQEHPGRVLGLLTLK